MRRHITQNSLHTGWLGVKLHPVRKQPKRLLATPLVQRITKPRTQAVTDKLKKNALVIRGTPAVLRAGVEPAPQFAQQRQPPSFARSDGFFQRADRVA